MKSSLLAFALTIFISSASFAGCGGRDEFTGVKEAEVASRGTLTCLIGGKLAKARLVIEKLFRCANSPVAGSLEFFDRKIDIEDVQRMSEISFYIETKQSKRSFYCELTELDKK